MLKTEEKAITPQGNYMNTKELQRFIAKTKPNKATGCIEWIGGCSPGGYGNFRMGKSTRSAHRASWEHVNGLVPKGLELDHLCRVRNCVNPLHLEPVTGKENMRRSPIYILAVRNAGLRNRKHLDLPEGVTPAKNKKNPYAAHKGVKGKNVHLGYFPTPELASEAYKRFCVLLERF